jgi:hypothetical protein
MGEPFWKVVAAVAAASVPLVVWITKRLVEQKLSRNLEAYKTELATAAKEREMRFGALVPKWVSGLVELFTALDNAYGLASVTCLAATAGARKRAEGDSPELETALSVYRANRLYIGGDLSEKIEALVGDIRKADTVEASKASEHANAMKAQRDAIEADFRVLLGSELSQPPSTSQS